MQALRIIAPGRPLAAIDLEDPTPAAGEVVVRVAAAGICRSDVHYRSGHRPVAQLPRVPGHEVAGVITATGAGVSTSRLGERVALHYLVTCGVCAPCRRGAEHSCVVGEMVGLDRDGGYAELIVVPERNALPVPEGVSMEAAAVMMCSTTTVLHALRCAELRSGETVAVFGVGGLGIAAIGVAQALGAATVFAVDINPVKLEHATRLGAVPVAGGEGVTGVLRTAGGVDVALELVGVAHLIGTALAVLAPGGRAVAVGITAEELGIDPYRDLIRGERSLLGCSDHTRGEAEEVLALAAGGLIDPEAAITARVPLGADPVNAAMDRLAGFGDDVRTVILPGERG